MGSGTPAGAHDAIDLKTRFKQLIHYFFSAGNVAGGADRVGAAARDDVCLASFRSHLVCDLLHFMHHVGAARNHFDFFDPQQFEQKVVAAGIRLITVRDALFEDKTASHSLFDGRSKGQPAVVGLHRAAGDQGVSALGQRICYEKFQFPGLVAAAGQSQQVVAFHVDGRSAQDFGKS